MILLSPLTLRNCFYFFFFTLVFIATSKDVNGEWKRVYPFQSKIIFKFDEDSIPRVLYFSIHDDNNGVTKNSFGVLNDNKIGTGVLIKIRYSEADSDNGFSVDFDTDILLRTPGFKDRSNVRIEEGIIKTDLGKFEYLLFEADGIPCLIAGSMFDHQFSPDVDERAYKMIYLTFCTTKDMGLTKETGLRLIRSIGVKGVAEPTDFFSFSDDKYKSQLSLEEVNNLFEKNLLTRQQYNKLVKQLLGLD